MFLTFSRERMRSLKNDRDEGIILKMISDVVYDIYENAIHFAETNSKTRFTYEIIFDRQVNLVSIIGKNNSSSIVKKNDIIKNIDAILTRLRTIFPDCSVEYVQSSFAKDRDGKEWDISAIDDAIRLSSSPFIDMTRVIVRDYIIIDYY